MGGKKCTLCFESVNSALSCKTRKRLNWASCSTELSCLKSIVTRRPITKFNTLTAFKLDDSEAFLCIKCQQLLLRVKKAKDKLAELTVVVKQKLDSLCKLDRPSVNPRKRAVYEESAGDNNLQVISMEPTILHNGNHHLNVATLPEVSVSMVYT